MLTRDQIIHDQATGIDWLVTPRPGETLAEALIRTKAEAVSHR